MTDDTTEQQKLEDYRKHLNKLIDTYSETYHLPQLTGAEKQISWATDIRIKVIEKIDKQKNRLSDAEKNALAQYLHEKTESRYWIDNKTMTWQEHLIHAKILAKVIPAQPEIPQPSARNPDNLVAIDTRNPDRIVVSVPESDNLAKLLSKKGFGRTETAWEKPFPKTDTGRTAFVESLCLLLLSSGYATQILAEEPKEPYHDGRLCVENGRLCLETSAQHVWKAASTIGIRKIWLDNTEPNAVRTLLNSYDIICTHDAKDLLER